MSNTQSNLSTAILNLVANHDVTTQRKLLDRVNLVLTRASSDVPTQTQSDVLLHELLRELADAVERAELRLWHASHPGCATKQQHAAEVVRLGLDELVDDDDTGN